MPASLVHCGGEVHLALMSIDEYVEAPAAYMGYLTISLSDITRYNWTTFIQVLAFTNTK